MIKMSILAAMCVSTSAIAAPLSTKNSETADSSRIVAPLMDSYLASYQHGLESGAVLNCMGEANLAEAGIIGGKLVMLVDAMIAAKDPRAKEWTGFIPTLPRCAFAHPNQLQAYSRTEETRLAIKAGEFLR